MLEVLYFYFFFSKIDENFAINLISFICRVDESDELLEPRLRERRGSCYKVTATAFKSKDQLQHNATEVKVCKFFPLYFCFVFFFCVTLKASLFEVADI